MKRILIGYICNVPGSGLDNYIFSLMDQLKDSDVCFDVLSSKMTPELVNRHQSDRIRFLPIPNLHHPIRQYKTIRKYLEQTRYDMACFNISEAFNCIGNLAAFGRVPVVITHSHSAGSNGPQPKRTVFKMAHYLMRPILNAKTSQRFSCSDLAAEWMYGRNRPWRLIRNTVDASKFLYHPEWREKWRTKLEIPHDAPVLGFAGALSFQKNPLFLLDVFEQVHKACPDAHLVIAGDGPLREDMRSQIEQRGLRNIHMTGTVSNVNELYSALDVFLLPSQFEGYPLVGVEAQLAGLQCIFSDQITSLIVLSPDSRRVSIEDPAAWRAAASRMLEDVRTEGRTDPTPFLPLADRAHQKQEFISIFAKGRVSNGEKPEQPAANLIRSS